MTVADIRDEFLRHRDLGRKAIDQVSDSGLNQVHGEHNSLAVNVRHLHGFLTARFTEFLTSDGDKPWRKRDEEFALSFYPRTEVVRLYEEGWRVAAATLATLSDADLARQVSFRGQASGAGKSLLSLLTHVAYHTGQIVLLARQHPEKIWAPLSTPAKPVKSAAQR